MFEITAVRNIVEYSRNIVVYQHHLVNLLNNLHKYIFINVWKLSCLVYLFVYKDLDSVRFKIYIVDKRLIKLYNKTL